VLLGNAEVDGALVLPLDRSGLGRVAVLGPTPRSPGPWRRRRHGVPPYTSSPVEGLKAALGPAARVDHGRGAPSTDRLPVAPLALLGHPDGGGEGVEVRLLAADGTVRGREDRATGAFTWLSRFGPDLPVAEVAAVEVRTRVRVPRPGSGCWARPGWDRSG
jgi:beta-glucosidase